jgi:hypothetical protein
MIYADNALKVLELGITPIPTNGKIPIITDWSRFSSVLATEDEVNSWVKKYPRKNIGIVLGAASGLVAIDVDIDNVGILKLVPYTPIVRKGKKGAVFFYKYNKTILTRKKRKGLPPIDILSDGTQVIIPSSIHPETKKPYVWQGDKSLIDRDELPELTQDEVMDFLSQSTIIYKTLPEYDYHESHDGRNNILKAMVVKMLDDELPHDEIIKELVTYDKINHIPPLFEDKKENVKPEIFLKNIKATLDRAGIIFDTSGIKVEYTRRVEEPPALVGTEAGDSSIDNESNKNAEDFSVDNSDDNILRLKSQIEISPTFNNLLTIREDNILIPLFQEINKRSDQDIYGISLSGALSIVATAIGQTWAINVDGRTTFPNMMSLMIAPSGLGKKAPFSLLKGDVCKFSKKTHSIVGKTGYGSNAGLFIGLNKQPVRLDLIEEMSEIFTRMGDKKSSTSASIMETLCTLWDSSESFFSPPESKAGLKDGTGGRFFNPHVNILSATTPNAFYETAKKFMVTSGALPRFLFFCDDLMESMRHWDDMDKDIDAIKRIAKWLDGALSVRRLLKSAVIQEINSSQDDETERAIIPRLLTIKDAEKKTLRTIYEQFRSERVAIGSGNIMEAFMARKWHHFLKLCLIHECALMPFHDVNFVNLMNKELNEKAMNERVFWTLSRESITFAYELIQKNMECANFYLSKLREDTTFSGDDGFENLCNRLEKVILSARSEGLKRSELRHLLGGRIKGQLFNDALSALLDEESVYKLRQKNEGKGKRPSEVFYHAKYFFKVKNSVEVKDSF